MNNEQQHPLSEKAHTRPCSYRHNGGGEKANQEKGDNGNTMRIKTHDKVWKEAN